jgi:hypothetical protein
VTPSGSPSVATALARLVLSLPELLVLAILWWLGTVVWLIAAIAVLISRRVPAFAWRYQFFVLGLHAQMLVYHASLTDRYPPVGAEHAAH